MADTSPSMWATLLPVVVGGVIGLAGGWIGPWLLERRKEAVEKRKRRAEKFEELVSALYEHKHWLDMLERHWVYGFEEKLTVTPFGKVVAISRVYFPKFDVQILELEKAAIEYEKWMYAAADARVNCKPSIDGLLEIYAPYAQRFRVLIDELGTFAQGEFK